MSIAIEMPTPMLRRCPEGEWQAAHAALGELARQRAGLDFEEGCCLLAARRAEAHRRLGYGSFAEYIERLFGHSPRLTHDKLRVAAALESLPVLARALREGGLSFSHARELTRVATPATEQIWLESAQGRTSREVERLVSGRRLGSLPTEPTESGLQRHRLRFEVSGETLASFREAVARLRRDAGEHLDDDATLLLLARQVLSGPTDDGRASYQVALQVCEACQRATQVSDGEQVGVSASVAAMARCDAQLLPSAHVGAAAGAAASARAGTAERAASRADATRASQRVPPAVRRSVLRRDEHCCRVPGCRHATFVDVHHLEAHADGGEHGAENLVTLCGVHHRAIHDGALVVTGSWATGLVFRHADGIAYGGRVSAPDVLVHARAFRALRGLGFGERDARQALQRVRCGAVHRDAPCRPGARLQLFDRPRGRARDAIQGPGDRALRHHGARGRERGKSAPQHSAALAWPGAAEMPTRPATYSPTTRKRRGASCGAAGSTGPTSRAMADITVLMGSKSRSERKRWTPAPILYLARRFCMMLSGR